VTEPTPKTGRRRRRRRRRGGGADGERDAAQQAREEREAKATEEAVQVVEGPTLDLDAPTDQPLTEEEVVEANRALMFVRKQRKVLRLRLNDAENLLVDGARPPEHRGQLKHLLAKVDRAAAVSALGRKPASEDPKARATMLRGVARISGDLDVLLMWLEALAESTGGQPAAAAFGAGVERIDFDAASPSRTDRLLRALEATFSGHERVLALFGLLENASFRRAFEASDTELSAGAAGRLAPLASVHRAYVLKAGHGPEVEAGLETMLAAPSAVLCAYRPAVRDALAEAAVKRGGPPGAVEALLKSLQPDSKVFQTLAWRWAGDRIRADREADAVRFLKKVRGDEAADLARALQAPRVGTYALVAAADDPDQPGIREGYDLGGQRPAVVRLGAPADSAAVVSEGQLQAALCLPGVSGAWGCGVGDRGTPFVAMPTGPELLPDRLKALPADQALRLAWDGVRILHALAAVGVALPGVTPGRFRGAPGGALELVDLAGARQVRVSEALQAHRALAQRWVGRALAWPPLCGDGQPRRETPNEVQALLAAPAPPEFAQWAVLAG
jgi:hypothetical protein